MSLDPESIQNLIDKLLTMAVDFGPKAITAVVILVIGFFVGGWIGKAMHRWLGKLEMEPPLRMLIVRIVRIVVLGNLVAGFPFPQREIRMLNAA